MTRTDENKKIQTTPQNSFQRLRQLVLTIFCLGISKQNFYPYFLPALEVSLFKCFCFTEQWKNRVWGPVSSYVKTENHSGTRNSRTLRHQQTPPPRLRYQGLKRIYVEEEKKTKNSKPYVPFALYPLVLLLARKPSWENQNTDVSTHNFLSINFIQKFPTLKVYENYYKI